MTLSKILFRIEVVLLTVCFVSCSATKPVKVEFTLQNAPPPPDYSNSFYWSALPGKNDFADHIPNNSPVTLIDGQQNASVDVFYLYPTSFFSRKEWNADLSDEKVNKSTDERAVKNQASVFNGSCKVYIPRYRQATFQTYFSLSDPDARKAFDLAYEDVKNAFQYYLDTYNNGRPIIIAGHSQGTTHAKQLLKDFFDGKPLQKQLVCAYLLGMPVYKNEFKNIPPSESPEQTGCFITWRSYLQGNEPKPKYIAVDKENILVTNPLTFNSDTMLVKAAQHAGGLGRDANTIYPMLCDVQIHEDIVWVSRPDIPGKYFIPKNLHPADYNLYWMQIRNNVELRVNTFISKNSD